MSRWISDRRWLMFTVVALASCGGGSGSGGSSGSSSTSPSTPTLTSIALSPLTVTLDQGGTIQLTVTGSFSDGSTATLPASNETFTSTNARVVTVNPNGLATIAAGASAGDSATVSAMDTLSGLSTTTANSAIVTVKSGALGPPTPTSGQAATDTAQNNAFCTAIQPFYWEIGDENGTLAGGSSTQTGGTLVSSSTRFPIASASKWIYAMYVVQQRGGLASLTSSDIAFLNFTSGYSYMGSDTQGATCTAPASGMDSINYCLTLQSTSGNNFNSQNPGTVGVFDYDSGHEENHAGQFQPEINALDVSELGNAIATGLGISGIKLTYRQPLLAGGIYASANDYAAILQSVLSGHLDMLGALGTHTVCAWIGSGCAAAYSPQINEHWHYSLGHWVEDDYANGDDGAFSSPGAFGFDPWIESNKKYYGVISRVAATGTGNQNGWQSAECAHKLRTAWETGVEQ